MTYRARWTRDGMPGLIIGTRAEVQALRDYMWTTFRIVPTMERVDG